MVVGRDAVRRVVRSCSALLTVLGVIAAAAGLGADVPPDRVLARPGAGNAAGSYGRNPIGALAPVDEQFIARRVGAVSGFAVSRGGRATTPTTTPRRSSPTPRPDGAIRGTPGAFPNLAPGGWVLVVTMQAQPTTVAAGNEIRYRMTIQNIGGEDFRGRSFTLEWDTPSGTIGRNGLDQCGLLSPAALRALCSSRRLFFTPALTEASHESFNSVGLVGIRAGGEWTKDWFVQTLPGTAPGTTYTNQARLIVTVDGQSMTTTSDPVVVTVA